LWYNEFINNLGGFMYDTTYDVGTTTAVENGVLAGLMGFFATFAIIIIAMVVVMIVCQWVIFKKAGKPGWAAIVPIYNFIVLLEIINRPIWWIAALFAGVIPVVGGLITLLFTIVIAIDLAKSFGKSTGFGILIALVPVVGYPILAFGSSQYIEGAGKGAGNPFSGFAGNKEVIAAAPVEAAPVETAPVEAAPAPAPEDPNTQ
jgi:hypothetical protein